MNAPENETPAVPSSDLARHNDTPSPAGAGAESTGTQAQNGPTGTDSTVLVLGIRLLDEIGRGGMGVVYRAHDTVLDRHVAVKVLPDCSPNGDIARRFNEESQITSQLQHPGIPPVHQVGTLPDGRRCMVMKLIKGDTLDKLLKKRATPDSDRSRFIAIFEHICQAVGYAHAHRLMHRDLKPANVMVGAFGEVQVMDWGLAKKLGDTRPSNPVIVEPLTEIGVLRESGPATQEGCGTFPYMAAEQAGGETEKMDERSDVFGLGAVLCVILTGEPPYVAKTAKEAKRMAIGGQLGNCFARLDGCRAEPELVALCKRCLAVEPTERPKDASEVAAAVAQFRATAEERARQAELDRVRDAARAQLDLEREKSRAEQTLADIRVKARERKAKRKVRVAVAVAAVLVLAAGGAFAWYLDRQRIEERAKADLRVAEQRATDEAKHQAQLDTQQRLHEDRASRVVETNLELAMKMRKRYMFKEAQKALEHAKLAGGGGPGRLARIEQARRDLAFLERLDGIRYGKWVRIVDPGRKSHGNTERAPKEYRKEFETYYELDLTALDTADAAQRVAASDIKSDVVAALDDWALHEPVEAVRNRLLEIARRADPGDWTDRLRDPRGWGSKAHIRALYVELKIETCSPAVLSGLALLMKRNELDPGPLLVAARARHPTDFELAFALSLCYPDNHEHQVRSHEVALALRHDNSAVTINLGSALYHTGDAPGAIAAFDRAIALDPKLSRAHFNLGVALAGRGDPDRAIAAFDRAIALDPECAEAHSWKGAALVTKGRSPEAIAACEQALALAPRLASAHYHMGSAHFLEKRYSEAIRCARTAVGVDPKFAKAHALLGRALKQSGDIPGARAAFTDAMRLDEHYAIDLATLFPLDTAPAPRAKSP